MSKKLIAEGLGTFILVFFGCGSAVLRFCGVDGGRYRPDFVGYEIAQIIGAIIAVLVIVIIAQGKVGYDVAVNGLGQNGHGAVVGLVFAAGFTRAN